MMPRYEMNFEGEKIRETINPDPNLSKKLLETLITSPLLGRGEPVPKPHECDRKKQGRLFEPRETPRKRHDSHRLSRRQVDLSEALRDKLVKFDLKRFLKDEKPEKDPEVRKMRSSSSRRKELSSSIDLKRKKKVEEFYQKSRVASETNESVGTTFSSFESASVPSSEELKDVERSLKLITFQTWSKEYSMFGTKYAHERSPSRLGNLAKDLHPEIEVEKTESTAALFKARDKSRKSTFLQRVYSTLDLDRGFKTTESGTTILSHETADFAGIDDLSNCKFPGVEPGHHCHSVAAAVLGKGKKEPVLSSDSSVGDIYESTRLSRDIIEERLRNVSTGDKRKEERKRDQISTKKRKKSKVSAKSKACQCSKYKRHRKCMKKDHELRNRPKSETEHFKVETERMEAESGGEKVLHHYPQPSKNVQPASKRDVLEPARLRSTRFTESTEKSFVLGTTCRTETCPSLKGMKCWKSGGTKKKNDDEDQPPEPSLHKEDSKVGIKGQIGGSRVNLVAQGSSVRTMGSQIAEEPCCPQTCQFSQPKLNVLKTTKSQASSSRQSSKKSSRKKQLCNVKCKIRGVSKRKHSRWKSKSNSTHSSKTSKRKLKKRKQKHFICTCHELKIKDSDSESDDLWVGMENLKRRRFSLMIDHVNKKKMAQCGGMAVKEAVCTCYICTVKDKPWSRYMKKANLLVDIPYFVTSKSLDARAREITKTKKTLREKFSWTEDNMTNYCSKNATCKPEDGRKLLLKGNPYGWKWCDKNKKILPKPKEENVHKEAPGRLGYFIELNDERLMIGEPHSLVQSRAERVAFCKWNEDVAKMKVNHFINNRPTQQSCFGSVRNDMEQGSCYNGKLMERLADLVQFSTDSDRSIHEFSFPSKMIKYQEPQLVGDAGSEMPEMKPLYETAKFPTIYRDLFKDMKHDQRKLMDAVLPPLQWTDNLGFWEMKVSLEPDDPETNRKLLQLLDHNTSICHAINKKFCAGNYRLHFEVFAEVIRQELLGYPERAILLSRIRDEYLLTMLLLDGGLEMTLTSTTHLWKEIEAKMTDESEIFLELEQEVERIRGEIKVVTAATYDLEKRSEELQTVAEYLHEDQGKLYKKTNIQLQAQIEAITAGYFYDLD